MEDYFTEVEVDVREAQRKDPDVVLPWSWWKEQSKKHGMSPNAIYTRAKKVGLYVPPSKRENGKSPSKPSPPSKPANPSNSTDRDPSGAIPAAPDPESGKVARSQTDRPPSPAPERFAAESVKPSSPAPPAPDQASPSHASARGLGDAIQGFSSLVERTAGLEQQVTDLSRMLEQAHNENRRLKRALWEMQGHAEKIRQCFLNTLQEE
ncbi:MAG: hypothetical protein KY468_02005 [Armatimonadetes bacterium]|nr:hypothetical protein [Armatimonadota bacterium]